MNMQQGPQMTSYSKTAAIRLLGTSASMFAALGMSPREMSPRPKNGKADLYTVEQVREAARRLGRWKVFVSLGGDLKGAFGGPSASDDFFYLCAAASCGLKEEEETAETVPEAGLDI